MAACLEVIEKGHPSSWGDAVFGGSPRGHKATLFFVSVAASEAICGGVNGRETDAAKGAKKAKQESRSGF